MSNLDNLRESIIRGEFCDTLPKLRKLMLAEVGIDAQNSRTPKINFTNETKFTLESLFASSIWECDMGNLEEDLNLLEKRITQSNQDLPFVTVASWIALKCRPNCKKEELHDAQTLLERYLRQCAIDVDTGSLSINQDIRQKYAYLVELLVIRVLLPLGLFESASSFILEENTRNDLLDEDSRRRIQTQFLQFQKKANKSSTCATGSNNYSRQPADILQYNSPEATAPVHSEAPSAQQMIEEFEKHKKKLEEQQTAMLKLVGGSISVSIVCIVLFIQRKRLSKFLSSLGDIIFPSN